MKHFTWSRHGMIRETGIFLLGQRTTSKIYFSDVDHDESEILRTKDRNRKGN